MALVIIIKEGNVLEVVGFSLALIRWDSGRGLKISVTKDMFDCLC